MKENNKPKINGKHEQMDEQKQPVANEEKPKEEKKSANKSLQADKLPEPSPIDIKHRGPTPPRMRKPKGGQRGRPTKEESEKKEAIKESEQKIKDMAMSSESTSLIGGHLVTEGIALGDMALAFFLPPKLSDEEKKLIENLGDAVMVKHAPSLAKLQAEDVLIYSLVLIVAKRIVASFFLPSKPTEANKAEQSPRAQVKTVSEPQDAISIVQPSPMPAEAEGAWDGVVD